MSYDELLASLRALETLPEDAAARAAPLVEEALRATARAGTAPDGTSWTAKKDGGAPLEHAADAIATKAVGAIVRTTLTGPTVFHHYGNKRDPRRPVLPDPGTIPDAVGEALTRGAEKAFDKAVG